MRLLLYTAAYWLMLTLRDAIAEPHRLAMRSTSTMPHSAHASTCWSVRRAAIPPPGEISAIRTFQKVVEATYAVPPVPIRLEHNMMLSPLIRIAVVFR